MAIQNDGKSVLSICLAKSGTKNQSQPEKTGLLENNIENKDSVFKQNTAFLASAPVAQLDRASVYGTVI